MGERRLMTDVPGERLDRFLARHLEDKTRGWCRTLIDRGAALVEGKPRGADYRLREGEWVTVREPEVRWPPMDFESWVLQEDKSLIVLKKPSGLLMHPLGETWLQTPRVAAEDAEPNLAGLLLGVRPEIEEKSVPRCGVVHRLDRATSGVLLVAKTPAAYEALTKAFAERRVQKTYRAAVLGEPKGGRIGVDAPVGRLPGRRRMEVLPWGRPAQTEFRVLETAKGAALVEAQPRTGRTHQIRVHLAELGHPVLGDYEWIREPEKKLIAGYGLPDPPRLMLHAYKLELEHPSTGKPLKLTAPVPKDFRDYWKSLSPA